MRVFLVGFMGSGKSYTGSRLAEAVNQTFIDLDDWIEKQQSQSIRSIFEQYGETHFRSIEREALHQMAQFEQAIISCGGGTPCFFNNMDWINTNGLSIYLKASPTLLSQRLLPEMEHRPILKGHTSDSLSDFIENKLQERAMYYEQAHVIFEQQEIKENTVKHLLNHYKKIIGH